MFTMLHTVKYMKTQASVSPSEAVIEFAGNVQRMARVHHYGLREKPSRKEKEVKYEARPLFGLKDDDINMIEQKVVDALH